MNTFITIENISNSNKICIEITPESREIYEIEIEGLYDHDFEMVTIYNLNKDIYFLSKEIAKQSLIKIETIDNEISN